jgi:hypothetical protein
VAGGVSVPVHFTEKFVPATPGAGEAPLQLNDTCGSVRVVTGGA